MAESVTLAADEGPAAWRLFLTFLRLGCTAIGGPAMFLHIRREIVDRQGWLTEDEFRLGLAAAQAVPGATAMQVSAWTGLRVGGLTGGFCAYLGFSLPAFLLLTGLSALYFAGGSLGFVAKAFLGLQAVVVAVLLHASLEFCGRYLTGRRERLLALLAAAWMGLHGNPIWALVLVCGLAVFLLEPVPAIPPVRGNGAGPRPWAVLVPLSLFLCLLAVLRLTGHRLFDLTLLMAKIDLFALGGGYVALPLMLHEVVEVHGFMDQATFMAGIALGQVTPGPIVMTSAFVGYALAGVVGAACAAVGAFSPSFMLMVAAAPQAPRLTASPLARKILAGSLVSLAGLLAAMTARVAFATPWTPGLAALGLGTLAALFRGVSILWVVPAGAVLGALLL